MLHAHRIRLACFSTLLAALATSSQSAIFDRDDRHYVSAAAGSPYSPLGVVIAGTFVRRRSTGFLVDECHVLTGEAVLGHGQSPLGKRAKFKAGLGTRQHLTTGGTVIAVGGSERIRSSAQQFVVGGRDWLLLRLDKCIGANLGYVTLKSGPFSAFEFRNLQSAGYPMGRSIHSGLTLDPSCTVLGSRGSVWLNDCAMTKGDEGDPIFRVSTSGAKPRLEVYAIQSAGYIRKKPVSMVSGYENQAVPIALIAPEIVPYLSRNSRQLGGGQVARTSEQTDAIPHVSGSTGVPFQQRLLDTRLGSAER